MKILLWLSFVVCFTSCEVYERYFIMASNRYGDAIITVKVKSKYDLPGGYITAGSLEMGCNADMNTAKENNFNKKIPIISDTVNLQYSFTLPACYTVWLQPANVGIPHIKYIIIDGKDTVATNGVNYVKYNSPYYFKKHNQQKFLLTVK
jgi:hypothetical protein